MAQERKLISNIQHFMKCGLQNLFHKSAELFDMDFIFNSMLR